jgi:surface antigen
MSGSQMIGDPSYTGTAPVMPTFTAPTPAPTPMQAPTPAPTPAPQTSTITPTPRQIADYQKGLSQNMSPWLIAAIQWATGQATTTPTVATKQQPVVSIEPPRAWAWTIPYNTSDINAMDTQGLRDYSNFLQTKIDMGQPLSEEEMYRARVAQDRIRQQTMAQVSQDTMQPLIDQQRSMISERQSELDARRAAAVTSMDERTRAQQERQFAEAERLAWQRREAQQSALSFSGFGRSTFAAEKQDEINRELNTYMTTAEEIRSANIDLYRMQLEWADSETIAGMYERLGQLKTQQAEMNRKMANDINMYNAEVAASYEEKLGNIMQMSQALLQSQQPLSEQDMATAMSYASLIIDNEWNVNEKILASVPDNLKPYVVMMWSQIKAETPPPMKFETVSPWQTLLDSRGNVVFQAPMDSKFSVAGNPTDWFIMYDQNTGKLQTIRWTNWVESEEPFEWRPYTSIPADTLQSAATSWASNFVPWTPWTRNGRCGQFVNDYLKSAWVTTENLFVDSLIDKKRYNNSSTPTVWAVAIMNSPTFPENWHVGIVLWVMPNGKVAVQSSNFNWDGKVTIDAIDPWKIIGYFNPSVQKQNAVKYDPTRSQVYLQVNENPKEATNLAKQLWVSPKTLITQAQAYKQDQIAQGSIPMLNNIDKLIWMLYTEKDWQLVPRFWSRIERIASWRPEWSAVSPRLADINALYDNITKTLWFENLIALKAKWATFGALTDSERQALTDVASSLKLNVSNEQFLSELQRVRTELIRVSGWDPRKTTQGWTAPAPTTRTTTTPTATPARKTVDSILDMYF